MKPIRRTALALVALAALGLAATPAEAKKKDRWRYDDRDRYYEERGNYDANRCADVEKRIDRARYEIRKWDGTGRHQGVVSWYKGDLENAMRDRDEYCRGGGRGRGRPWWRDTSYDDRRYYEDDRYYDDRYDDAYYGDEGFDLKRDWPSLLGILINPQVGVGR